MKPVQKAAQTATLSNDSLFDTPIASKTFPEPIWLESGDGQIVNGRLIFKFKVSSNLKQYVKNDQLSFILLKRKKPSIYGKTYSVLLNQDEWPDNNAINRNFLTLGVAKNSSAIAFTLTLGQLDSLRYTVDGKPGEYAKMEVVDNGMQIGIFRFFNDPCKESVGFKGAQKLTPVTPTITRDNAEQVAKNATDDFLNDL